MDDKNLGDLEPEEEEESLGEEPEDELQIAFDRVVGQKQFVSGVAGVLGAILFSAIVFFVWPVPHWTHFGLGVRRPAVSETAAYKDAVVVRDQLAASNAHAKTEIAGLKRQVSELEGKLAESQKALTAAQPKTETEDEKPGGMIPLERDTW